MRHDNHSPRSLLRPSLLLAALAPAFGGCLAEPAPEDAFDRTEDALDAGKVYEIVSVHSGLALDVTGKSKDDGAKIQQWAYGGGANQKWKLVPGSDGYEIVGVGSDKCLDVTGRCRTST
jgi:hypothetical protein